ncbi:Helix-turn-helix domain-containing protein [Nocardioides sp. YR527]|uniref:helix-turn-helix domain-containing protein n=1 Tax=Nocardioides sp. YR527 TaxID=1881028 RepID=UPI000886F543|nr:helix-turn-helix domain-containing protein [Nocardioides sp. YR527]SDL15470.1 Helix-turn-helix domain-containing protein [Nocardioides sp. YR527]
MPKNRWPLGAYINEARGTMAMREAARRAGISETWWRAIESGTQKVGGVEVSVTVKPETVVIAARTVNADPSKALELADYDPADYQWLLDSPASKDESSVEDHKEWFAGLPREEREEVLAELQRLNVDIELTRGLGRRRSG